MQHQNRQENIYPGLSGPKYNGFNSKIPVNVVFAAKMPIMPI
jgi:hypothetical protein